VRHYFLFLNRANQVFPAPVVLNWLFQRRRVAVCAEHNIRGGATPATPHAWFLFSVYLAAWFCSDVFIKTKN